MELHFRDRTAAELIPWMGNISLTRAYIKEVNLAHLGVVMKHWKKSVLGAAMASALIAGGASVPAFAATVKDISDAKILGKGASVQGTYTVVCESAGEFGQVYLELTRRTGGGGSTSAPNYGFYQCDEAGQEIPFIYEFNSNGTVFKKGVAVIGGEVQTCDASFACTHERIPAREINLIK